MKASEIPYPTTLKEAWQAWNELSPVFANGEPLHFDMIDQDEESLIITRIALDDLNDTISIFHFGWLFDSGHELAIDCIHAIHLNEKEARIIADTLIYFIKILEQKGDDQ